MVDAFPKEPLVNKVIFEDTKSINIPVGDDRTIRVRDVAAVFDKLPNGATIQDLSFNQVFGVAIKLRLDGGTIRDE